MCSSNVDASDGVDVQVPNAAQHRVLQKSRPGSSFSKKNKPKIPGAFISYKSVLKRCMN